MLILTRNDNPAQEGGNPVRDLTASDMFADDIAALLDAALADPAQAPRVRAAMRSRLAAASPTMVEDDADAEDLWDNVPL
jgi:hypothetical protein